MYYTTVHECIAEFSKKQSKTILNRFGEEFNFVSFERSVKFLMNGKNQQIAFSPFNYIENLVFHLFNPDCCVQGFIKHGMDIGTNPFKKPAGNYNLYDSLDLLEPIFFGSQMIPFNLSHFVFQCMKDVSNNDMRVVNRISKMDLLDLTTWS
ncbi:hypothetical protein HC766_01065 [Candidatus Gracilibacteria bacterium]|nr:hypothetical protein [Candidatus Gracilibacteria bacterium]NJS40969.1 hypothetical protein [Candidatus Gracilibacteria bacterium]